MDEYVQCHFGLEFIGVCRRNLPGFLFIFAASKQVKTNYCDGPSGFLSDVAGWKNKMNCGLGWDRSFLSIGETGYYLNWTNRETR